MGVDPLQVASLLTGSIPMVQGLVSNYQLRHDPLLQDIGRIGVDQYNALVQQNPYGNPMTGWGGMFGTNADGSPTGFGEAYARALGGMLGQSQGAGNQALANYAQLSQSGSPQMVDAASPMRQMMGMAPSYAFQSQPGGQIAGGVSPYGIPNPGVSVPSQGAGAPQNQQALDRNDINSGIGLLDIYFNNLQNQNAGGGGSSPTPQPPSNMRPPYYGNPAVNGGGSYQQAMFGYGGAKSISPQASQMGQHPAQQQAAAVYQGMGGNPYSQLMNAPVAYTQQMQDQLYNQAKQGIDAESRNALRQMRETAGAQGYLDSGQMRAAQQQLEQNRINQLAQARLGIGQRAAETNYNQLAQSAGLQSQTTQGLSQLDLAQNQQRQDAYNQNYSNTARTIDQMYGINNQGMANAQNLWAQLQQTGLAGINLPNQALGQVEQRQMNRIVGPSVSSGPTYIGGTSGGGGGNSGSSGIGNAIGQGLGYWAAGGFQSPWS